MLMIPEREYGERGWIVHRWNYKNDEITVLQREPFRLSWFATQLVTFVFLIPYGVEDFSEIANDYSLFRKFSGKNKRSQVPFLLQCGYAILPIYISGSFSSQVIENVQTTEEIKLGVFYNPSLLETQTGHLYTLKRKSTYGCVYRNYMHSTICEIANLVMRYQEKL